MVVGRLTSLLDFGACDARQLAVALSNSTRMTHVIKVTSDHLNHQPSVPQVAHCSAGVWASYMERCHSPTCSPPVTCCVLCRNSG